MAQRLIALAAVAALGVASSAAAQSGEPVGPEPAGAEPTADTEPSESGPESETEAEPAATTEPATAEPAGATTASTTRWTRTQTSQPSRSETSRRTTPTRPGARDGAEAPPEEEEEEWGAFYIQLLGGYSFANLVSFQEDNFLPEAERLEGSGFFGGAGLGFRIHIVTLGAQATLASYAPTADDGFELGTVIGTVGLHLPVPGIQPYFRVGAGYAWMGKANYMDPGISETRVYGFVIEGGFGVDIKLARAISLGLGVDAAYLNLGRQSASEVGMIDDVSFEEDGDAVGVQIRGHVHLTFHI